MTEHAGTTLLVTGASGFLGWNLCGKAMKRYHVIGVCNTNATGLRAVTDVQGDLTNESFRDSLIPHYAPDAVIHTAAAADPNFCENNPELAEAINVTATITLARQCREAGIPFLFTSSDLVFDGRHPPYREDASVSPLNRYGRQKAVAEREILDIFPGAAVCRMPLMYGDAPSHAKSFLHPMITAMRSGAELRLFTDEYRTPASASDAAEGLLLVLEKKLNGIVHLGGPERLSRYDMGVILAATLNSAPFITSCLRKDVSMPAPRAADVSLDSSRAMGAGFAPHRMREELGRLDCIRKCAE